MTQSAANPLTSQQIAQYNNPYTQQVVQATENQFNQQNAQQQNSLKGSAAAAGALGGDRQAVAQAQLAGQQQTAQAPVIAGLEQQGYNQALQTAAQQFQQNPMAAANQLGNLGLAGQTAGLQEGQAQVGAGTLQQQTQQAQDTAQYQQYLQQQGYPFQIAQLLGQLALPATLAEGQNSYGTQTTPGPSGLQQGLGIAALLGGLFSRGGEASPFANHFAGGGSSFRITGLPYSGGPSYVPGDGGAVSAHLNPASLQFAKPAKQPSVQDLTKGGSSIKKLAQKIANSDSSDYGGLLGGDLSGFGDARGGRVSGYAGGGSPYGDTGLPYSGGQGYMPNVGGGVTAHLNPVNLQFAKPAQQPSTQQMGQLGQSLGKVGKGVKNFLNDPSYGGGNPLSGDAWGGSAADPTAGGELSGLTSDDFESPFKRGGFVDAVNAIHDTIHRARMRGRQHRAGGGNVSPFAQAGVPRYADGGSDDSDDDGGQGGTVGLPAGVTTGSGTNPDAGPVTPDTPLYSPFMNVPDQPSPEAFNPNQGTPDPSVFSGGAKPLPFASASAAGNPNLAAQSQAQGIAASPFDRGVSPNSVAAAAPPGNAAPNNLPASVPTGAAGAAAPPVPGLPAAGSSPMTATPQDASALPAPGNVPLPVPRPDDAPVAAPGDSSLPLNPSSHLQPDTPDASYDTGRAPQGPADVQGSQPQSRMPQVQTDFMNFFAPQLGKIGAAGMLGSVIGEVGQGLSPTQYGDHGTSYTVFQLHDDPSQNVHNQRDFRNWAQQNGLNPDDRLTQYRYIQSYLQNHPQLADRIRNAKTPAEAADIWTRDFEQPANAAQQSAIRQRYAENAYADFMGNPRNPSTLASTPTGGGGGGGAGGVGVAGRTTDANGSPTLIERGLATARGLFGGDSNPTSIGPAGGLLGHYGANDSPGLFGLRKLLGLSDQDAASLRTLGAGLLASTSPFPGVALGQAVLGVQNEQDRQQSIEQQGADLARKAAAKPDVASLIPGAVKVGGLSAGTYLDNKGQIHPMPNQINTEGQLAEARRVPERPQPPAGDNGAALSGQAYIDALNKMDAQRARLAKAVGDYSMSVNEATGRGASREGLMADVLAYNPDFHANLYKGQGSTIMAFSSGAKADTVRSLNVLIGHLGTLDEATDALANGNNTLLNRARNNWEEMTGQPAPTNYDAVATIVSDELTKAVVPRGAEGDRERAIALLRRDHSPQAIRGVVQMFKKMMASQVDGLRQQYEAGTGMHDFNKFLLPETQEALAGLGRDGRQPAAGAPSGGAPAAGSPAAPAASSRPSGVPANAVPRQFKGRTVWFDPDTRKPYPGQ